MMVMGITTVQLTGLHRPSSQGINYQLQHSVFLPLPTRHRKGGLKHACFGIFMSTSIANEIPSGVSRGIFEYTRGEGKCDAS